MNRVSSPQSFTEPSARTVPVTTEGVLQGHGAAMIKAFLMTSYCVNTGHSIGFAEKNVLSHAKGYLKERSSIT